MYLSSSLSGRRQKSIWSLCTMSHILKTDRAPHTRLMTGSSVSYRRHVASSGMSQHYYKALGTHLQTVSSFKVTSNPTPVHFLSRSKRESTARLRTTIRSFQPFDEDVCDTDVSSGTVSDDGSPYRDKSFVNPVLSPSISISPLLTGEEPKKVCQWSLGYLCCFAFKFNHSTGTGYTTTALNSREAAVLSEHIFTSRENDPSTSLSSAFYTAPPFLTPLHLVELFVQSSCCTL